MDDQQQAADARQNIDEHQPDRNGFCRMCGGRHPCHYVRDARSLLARLDPTPPDLPAGTRLSLVAGEWHHLHNVPPGARYDLVVARVGDTVRDGRVSVSGHDVTCAWESVDPHPPCIEVQVSVAALQRHALHAPVPGSAARRRRSI